MGRPPRPTRRPAPSPALPRWGRESYQAVSKRRLPPPGPRACSPPRPRPRGAGRAGGSGTSSPPRPGQGSGPRRRRRRRPRARSSRRAHRPPRRASAGRGGGDLDGPRDRLVHCVGADAERGEHRQPDERRPRRLAGGAVGPPVGRGPSQEHGANPGAEEQDLAEVDRPETGEGGEAEAVREPLAPRLVVRGRVVDQEAYEEGGERGVDRLPRPPGEPPGAEPDSQRLRVLDRLGRTAVLVQPERGLVAPPPFWTTNRPTRTASVARSRAPTTRNGRGGVPVGRRRQRIVVGGAVTSAFPTSDVRTRTLSRAPFKPPRERAVGGRSRRRPSPPRSRSSRPSRPPPRRP